MTNKTYQELDEQSCFVAQIIPLEAAPDEESEDLEGDEDGEEEEEEVEDDEDDDLDDDTHETTDPKSEPGKPV